MSGRTPSSRILTLAVAFAVAGVFTSDLRAKPRKITSVEGITEYRLDNGLQVLLFPDPSQDTVTVNITYFVGSRHEGYGETGMAHLLEHLVFKGTPKNPQVWKALQDHGARFNGTTSYDRTNYFETMAASDENLEFGLQLEADRMINSFIAKKDLDSEFSVVRNEFEMGENNPLGILSERMYSTAYLWHNYGKSTIGSREDIERVPIERLQAFYRKFYQPDNAMLVVAGKFDEPKALERIENHFGKIARPDRQLEKTYTVEPAQDGEREVMLRRVGDVQAVGAVYHICAGSHTDMPALEVLADILDASQTGRLYKALVETEMATRVSVAAESLHDPGFMEVMAEVRLEKSLDDVRKTMFDVLDGLANEKFTEEEVERAKTADAKNFSQLMNESGRVGIVLTEYAAMGDWRLLFVARDRMEKVTVEDVQRVAAHYLKPSNRTIGMFIPTKEPSRTKVPETPDVMSIVKDYKGRESVAAGETFDATPANIESRVQRSTLPIGTKLALLPKKTRGAKVNAQIILHYGSEEALKDHIDAAGFIDNMLDKGTTKHTKRQLADELDKLKANVRIGGGGGGRRGRMGMGGGGSPGTLSISIDGIRETFPATLKLVGEMLRDSTFPEKEFNKLKKQTLSRMEQMRSEPMGLAPLTLSQHLNPYPKGNIRYVPGVDEHIEMIKAVKLDDVKKLYQELLGADSAEVAIVGDFDAAEVTSLLTEIFKDWKSKIAFKRIEMPYQENEGNVAVLETPDKANSIFVMGMNLPMRDDDPDYVALNMGNFMLGGNANSRLLNRIRQKEGLSYGCGSAFSASPIDKSGTFMSYGICAPENTEKAVSCAQEEIDRILKDGVSAKELDDARKGYLEQAKVGFSNDGMVAGMLARDLYLHRTMKFRQEELDKVAKLSMADVNGALKKYINPKKLVVVRAGDFSKKDKDTPEPTKLKSAMKKPSKKETEEN